MLGVLAKGTRSPSALPTRGSSLDSPGDTPQGPRSEALQTLLALPGSITHAMCTWALPLVPNDRRYQEENRGAEDERLIAMRPFYLRKMKEALLR